MRKLITTIGLLSISCSVFSLSAYAYDVTNYGSVSCGYRQCQAEVRQKSTAACEAKYAALYQALMDEHKTIYYKVPCFSEVGVKSAENIPDQEYSTGDFVGRILYYR